MSFSDLFGSGEHLHNLRHFAAIVNMAAADGQINEREQAALARFARKLEIGDDEYVKVIENPESFPIESQNSYEQRLERLHDLFTIIFSDHEIDKEEATLLKKYAIGLGFSSASSDALIARSIKIFNGEISFEDYKYILNRK